MTKSAYKKIEPASLVDVTSDVINAIEIFPTVRAIEGENAVKIGFKDAIRPQENDQLFFKFYIKKQILEKDKITIVSDNIIPNYSCRIFSILENGNQQLILVGMPNDLDLNDSNSLVFPFWLYIPPAPQDNAKAHRKRNLELYKNIKDDDVPYRYKEKSKYPYEWDYLYFQLLINAHRISFQFRKNQRQFVFVVPLVKDFLSGIGPLAKAPFLEKVLLGIQKFYLDKEIGKDKYTLQDVRQVAISSFSIGCSLLARFIEQNREEPFYREAVSELVIFDPAPLSPIINTIISTNNKNKKIMLYSKELQWFKPLIKKYLTPKNITVDSSKSFVFDDSNIPELFMAYLKREAFHQSLINEVKGDIHQLFPSLFLGHAASISSRKFLKRNGKFIPELDFLWWHDLDDKFETVP
jgi:hypothetical protein